MPPRNAFYAQSGGVSAVINASACGVLETARRHSDVIGKVYAGRNGIIGALTEDLIDTSLESEAAIGALRHTPGAAFGSCRYKLKSIREQSAQYERLLEVFRAHDIGFFFYNGGGDSQDTAFKVSQIGTELGYPIVGIGIPKTVDNDIPVTDCSPGFGSMAKYVATSLREAAFDLAAMSRTSTRVFALEVMGRHAGWTTAVCALAAEQEGDWFRLTGCSDIVGHGDGGRRKRRVRWTLRMRSYQCRRNACANRAQIWLEKASAKRSRAIRRQRTENVGFRFPILRHRPLTNAARSIDTSPHERRRRQPWHRVPVPS